MVRVAQIGQFPLDAKHIEGGVESSVLGLAKAQNKTCEVCVFDFPRIGGNKIVEFVDGVEVHRFGNLGGRQFASCRQVPLVVREIQDYCPDVCHIHGTSLFAWRMFKGLKKGGLPVVVTVHGLVRIEKRNALKNNFSLIKLFQFLYQSWVEKHFISQLTMAIVDTEYVKNKVNLYPIRRMPEMCVIPQGIDDSFFSLRCSVNSKMILSVGAIGERKGHLLLLRAFEQAMDDGMDAHLVIAGVVVDEQYLLRLKSAILQSKYRDSVSLHTNLADKDLKKLYENAHLFALHSEEESQGIVFAEAMALGLPIVSTRVGGVPYVVEHGRNGLLSSYGDLGSFAEYLRCLMDDTVKWTFMSEASKQISLRYHWKSISDRIMQSCYFFYK